MTRTRWTACAGLLALCLGGFVVCANDKAPKPAPAGRQTEPQCPAQCPSQCPGQCPSQCPSQCPCPSNCDPSCPAPVAAQPDAPVVPAVVVPPMAAPAPVQPPAPPPMPPAIRQVSMTTPAAATSPVPYKIRIEMVGGITHVELLRGDDVALRAQCDRLDVQMPAGGLHAIGKVTVTAPGMTIRCNRLMLGWHTGEIAMEGQVRIMCQNGQQRTEMAAESVSCRLNNVGGGLDLQPTQPLPALPAEVVAPAPAP